MHSIYFVADIGRNWLERVRHTNAYLGEESVVFVGFTFTRGLTGIRCSRDDLEINRRSLSREPHDRR